MPLALFPEGLTDIRTMLSTHFCALIAAMATTQSMLTVLINLGRSSGLLLFGGLPSRIGTRHSGLVFGLLSADSFRSTQQRICSGFSPDSLFTEWHLVAMPSDTKVPCKFSETFLFYYLIVRNFSSPLKKNEYCSVISPITQKI